MGHKAGQHSVKVIEDGFRLFCREVAAPQLAQARLEDSKALAVPPRRHRKLEFGLVAHNALPAMCCGYHTPPLNMSVVGVAAPSIEAVRMTRLFSTVTSCGVPVMMKLCTCFGFPVALPSGP